jgi:hypothetical protein
VWLQLVITVIFELAVRRKHKKFCGASLNRRHDFDVQGSTPSVLSWDFSEGSLKKI